MRAISDEMAGCCDVDVMWVADTLSEAYVEERLRDQKLYS